MRDAVERGLIAVCFGLPLLLLGWMWWAVVTL
jgi:hypothetical protein